MSPILILIAAFLVMLVLAAWNGQPKTSRARFHSAVEENLGVLLVLAALLLVPAALLLPLPEFIPQPIVLVIGLTIFGGLTSLYWTRINPLPSPLRPLRVVQPQPANVDAGGDLLKKTFRWTFTDRHQASHALSFEICLSQQRYQAARSQPRLPIREWADYVLADMPELDDLTARFAHILRDKDWSTLDRCGVVLSFTQACIRYVADRESTGSEDWPRYPIETLMDEAGDCEDDAILACAVLKRLGFEVVLLIFPAHCALGVAGAQGLPGHFVHDQASRLDYFYGETTSEGWRLGELPEMLRGVQPEMILPVKMLVE